MAKGKKSFVVDVMDVIQEETEILMEEFDAILDETARECAVDLQHNSPKHTGQYASGWQSETSARHQRRIRNVKKPTLTHLLENGRICDGRIVGHRPHIEKAKKKSEKELIRKLTKG